MYEGERSNVGGRDCFALMGGKAMVTKIGSRWEE
jgi:hypothetical protein